MGVGGGAGGVATPLLLGSAGEALGFGAGGAPPRVGRMEMFFLRNDMDVDGWIGDGTTVRERLGKGSVNAKVQASCLLGRHGWRGS